MFTPRTILNSLYCLMAGLLLLVASVAQGQDNPSSYSFASADTATLYDMSGSTLLVGPHQDEVVTDAIRLPFPFALMGALHQTFNVTTDGQVNFSPTSQVYFALYPLKTGGGNNRKWDGSSMGTGPQGSIRMKTEGTAPYRKLIIGFEHMSLSEASGNDDATFQVVLRETSGTVEFIYGSITIGDTMRNCLEPGLGRIAYNQYLFVNTDNHTAYSSNSAYTFTRFPGALTALGNGVAGSCRNYTFTPPPVADFADTTMSFPAVVSGVAGFNITDYVAGLDYFYYVSKAPSGPFRYAGRLTESVLTGHPDSTYYYRIYRNNGAALSTNYAAGQVTFGPRRVFVSQGDGQWSNNNTWGTPASVLPVYGDSVVIAAGDSVALSGPLGLVYAAAQIRVEGLLDFAAFGRNLMANNLHIGAQGEVRAHNASVASSPATITGNIITLSGSLTGDGYLDMRYPQSVLSLQASDDTAHIISVHFREGDNSTPLLRKLQLSTVFPVRWQSPVTINEEISAYFGTITTNGNITINNTAGGGGGYTASQVTIHRYGRMPLFSGTVSHAPGSNLTLNYYAFNAYYQIGDYSLPDTFTAGAEIPDNDTIGKLQVFSYTGVAMDRDLTVKTELNISGNLYCGNHDFTFTGNIFYYNSGMVNTTGQVRRLLYQYPYTGGMEQPGDTERLFPVGHNRLKRFGFLQGEVSADGIFGLSYTPVPGTAALQNPYTENGITYGERYNGYWSISAPAMVMTTSNAFHFIAAGTQGISNLLYAGLSAADGAAPGSLLPALGGKSYPILRRTGLSWASVQPVTLHLAYSNIPLPAGVVFRAAKQEQPFRAALLDWTLSDARYAGWFTVEKSPDGRQFEPIGRVPVSAGRYYTYTDNSPAPGDNFYRLHFSDGEGQATYTPVRKVTFPVPAAVRAYPNPVTDLLYIDDGSGTGEAAPYRLNNAAGVSVRSGMLSPDAGGNNRYHLPLQGLKAGVYYLEWRTGDAAKNTVVKILKR